MSDDLKQRMDFAAELAWEAGRVTLRHFQTRLDVELKADQSPVTVADRAAETLLRERIERAYPGDAVLGEEHGEVAGSSGFRWVVDPIDGTKTFVQGVPLFGVMVGLLDPREVPVVGAIAFPGLGELVVAAAGEGCRWNGRPARVSEVAELAESLVVYTGRETNAESRTESAFERVAGAARLVRNWGDCYGHVLVATGRAEVMLDPVLADWDCVALQPIVEEAGGVFTDWRGEVTPFGKSGISTNAAVRAELSALLEA